MYKRSICPKFLPGDHAEVLNYRKRPREWEACVVERVEASIGRTSTSLSYAVATERTIPDKYTSGEHPLRLTVGNEWIR